MSKISNKEVQATENLQFTVYSDLVVYIETAKFKQQITSSSSVARMNLSKFLHKFCIIVTLNYGVKVVLMY